MGACFSCGASLEFDRVYRTTECPKCRKPVKVCLNCRFYDPGAHWECRETIAEPVREKEKVNFCDYFEPAGRASAPKGSKAEGARKELGKLFND